MSSFQSIFALLKACKIYSLHDNSLVLAEMRAYALALDALYDKAQTLLDDGYYDSLLGAYSHKFEALYGFRVTNLASATAQEEASAIIALIKKRLAITNSDFTVEGIAKCIDSLGIGFTYTENPLSKYIEIQLIGDMHKHHHSSLDLQAMVRALLPYHSDNVILFPSA